MLSVRQGKRETCKTPMSGQNEPHSISRTYIEVILPSASQPNPFHKQYFVSFSHDTFCHALFGVAAATSLRAQNCKAFPCPVTGGFLTLGERSLGIPASIGAHDEHGYDVGLLAAFSLY